MMISVDTNIIVRLLTGNDQKQFLKSESLFAKESILITTTVILECEWVLRYAYQFNQFEVANAFRALFGLSNVKLQDPPVIENAIKWYSQGMDFADAIHLAKSRKAEAFVTFEKKTDQDSPKGHCLSGKRALNVPNEPNESNQHRRHALRDPQHRYRRTGGRPPLRICTGHYRIRYWT